MGWGAQAGTAQRRDSGALHAFQADLFCQPMPFMPPRALTMPPPPPLLVL